MLDKELLVRYKDHWIKERAEAPKVKEIIAKTAHPGIIRGRC